MRNVDEFILYGHHHDRADHYEIQSSQMTIDLFLFTQIFSFLYHRQDLFGLYSLLKIAELDCCQIIILSIYVPSTHAYTHVLRLSLDLPYETR